MNFKELTISKEEFQEIVRLLVEFDEKTGRYLRYQDKETHYMRKSISVCSVDTLRIFLHDLGGFIYYIVCEIQKPGGFLVTAWVHEDGIRTERDDVKDNPSHPVHSIICISDLYERAFEVKQIQDAGLSLQTTEIILRGMNHEAIC